GNLQTLLVLVKGLPLAYNRDLQEDKPAIFDSFDTVNACLELAAPLVAQAELNRKAIAERLDRGYLDATTLMEYLIRRDIPQRTAHGLVGRLVRKAMDRGVRLADLKLEDFTEAHADLDQSVYEVLGVDQAIAAMTSFGSTGPEQVRQQLAGWKELFEQETVISEP
ncbi:MAG TPA: argininosuccinate lyase, partial [Thermoguttaceae bacterium]|nr:argininosuccinate lyase [Thermoguttaceae bacterium]